jgi:hypothetical protein
MLTLFTFALAAVCLRAQDGHSADEAAIRENLKADGVRMEHKKWRAFREAVR